MRKAQNGRRSVVTKNTKRKSAGDMKKDVEGSGSLSDSNDSDVPELKQFQDELENISTALNSDNYFNKKKTRKHNRKEKALNGSENFDFVEKVECDLGKLRKWFQVADNFLPKEIKQEVECSKKGFTDWFLYLSSGFNLLVYGIGSKISLLNDFADEFLSDYSVLTIDAFHSSVNVRTILQKLDSELSLKCSCGGRNLTELSTTICSALDRRKEDIFLLINNIDGPGMRESTQQKALAELAKCSYVHIVASFDHFNAPLMWNQEMLIALNFIWLGVSTMRSYVQEILAGESKLLGLHEKSARLIHTKASLDVIWLSLTSNSQMILYKIAKIFYETKEPVEFFFLFRQAREDFLVQSDIALRQHLNEFSDHGLVGKKRESDGREYVSILIDKDLMTSFLEEKGLIMDEAEED